jgi:hypothetical protein
LLQEFEATCQRTILHTAVFYWKIAMFSCAVYLNIESTWFIFVIPSIYKYYIIKKWASA